MSENLAICVVTAPAGGENLHCDLHAEEVHTPPLTAVDVEHVNDGRDIEDHVPHNTSDIEHKDETWCLSAEKVFIGTSPAKCFIGCESVVLIPCTPCCIYVPAMRRGVTCVQVTSRVLVLVPVFTLLAVLLCPFVYASVAHDCFSSPDNKCIPVNARAEQVLLSFLLCAPYNQSILEDNCWPVVSNDEQDFFGRTISDDIVEYFR